MNYRSESMQPMHRCHLPQEDRPAGRKTGTGTPAAGLGEAALLGGRGGKAPTWRRPGAHRPGLCERHLAGELGCCTRGLSPAEGTEQVLRMAWLDWRLLGGTGGHGREDWDCRVSKAEAQPARETSSCTEVHSVKLAIVLVLNVLKLKNVI